MPHPAWLGDGFAAVLVVVGGYCLARLAAAAPLGRRTHSDVNLGHVLMALAMVGMLVPGWQILPDRLWAAVFAGVALWFLGRAARRAGGQGTRSLAGPAGLHVRHYAVHGVMALSMVYMEAVAPSGGLPGPVMGGGAGVPTVTLAFMVVLLASAVWQLNGASQLAGVPSGPVVRLAVVAAMATGAARSTDGPPARGPASRTDPGTMGGHGSPASLRPWLAPRLEVACHVAMCVVMAYMLVLMV